MRELKIYCAGGFYIDLDVGPWRFSLWTTYGDNPQREINFPTITYERPKTTEQIKQFQEGLTAFLEIIDRQETCSVEEARKHVHSSVEVMA